MPALPMNIYHQGGKLLDRLKSYYVKEPGKPMLSISPRLLPSTAHFVPTTPSGNLALAISRDSVSPTGVACRDKMMCPSSPPSNPLLYPSPSSLK